MNAVEYDIRKSEGSETSEPAPGRASDFEALRPLPRISIHASARATACYA